MGLYKRAVFQFSQYRYAWSESYYYVDSSASLAFMAKQAEKLFATRMLLCGKGVEILGGYVSDDDEWRDSYPLQLPVKTTSGRWNTDFPDTSEYEADQPFVSVVVRAGSGDWRTKITFLSGTPDVLSTVLGSYNVNLNAAWESAFKKWRAALTDKWGWKGIAQSNALSPRNAITQVERADGHAKFTVTADPTYKVGQLITVRGVRSNASNVNGKQKVTSIDVPTKKVFTDREVDADYQYLSGGYIQGQVYTLYPITSLTAGQFTHRKRGGRTGLPRGRS